MVEVVFGLLLWSWQRQNCENERARKVVSSQRNWSLPKALAGRRST